MAQHRVAQTPTIEWAEMSLGRGPPPFYLDPRIVDVVHSIFRSLPAADTEKVQGLLIGLIRLLWRLK